MGGETVGQRVELAVGQLVVAVADRNIFREFFHRVPECGECVQRALLALGPARPFLQGSRFLGEEQRDLRDRLALDGIERSHQFRQTSEEIADERLSAERAVDLQGELRAAADFEKQKLRAGPLDPRVKIDPTGKSGLDEVSDFWAAPCEPRLQAVGCQARGASSHGGSRRDPGVGRDGFESLLRLPEPVFRVPAMDDGEPVFEIAGLTRAVPSIELSKRHVAGCSQTAQEQSPQALENRAGIERF